MPAVDCSVLHCVSSLNLKTVKVLGLEVPPRLKAALGHLPGAFFFGRLERDKPSCRVQKRE